MDIANSFRYGKKEAKIIQGFGLLLIFCCHFLTPFFFTENDKLKYQFSDILIFQIPIELYIQKFANSCRAIFAFCTGYALYTKRECYKSVKYSFAKTIKILVNYWIVLIPFYTVMFLAGDVLPEKSIIFRNFFALDTGTVDFVNPVFCAYIFFYYTLIIVAPVWIRIYCATAKTWYRDVFWLLGLLGLNLLWEKLQLPMWGVAQIAITNWKILGLVAFVGYQVAKTKLFEKIDLVIENTEKFYIVILCCLFLIGGLLRGIIANELIGMIVAPLLIYPILGLVKKYPKWIGWRVAEELGEKSLNMWIISCFVFSPYETLEKYFIWPKYAILIWLNAVVVCYILAIPLCKLQGQIWKMMRKLIGCKKGDYNEKSYYLGK